MMMNPGAPTEDEEVAAEDEEDMGVIETYSNYWPSKLKVSIDRSNPRVWSLNLSPLLHTGTGSANSKCNISM